MQIKFLSAIATKNEVNRFMSKYDEYYWAVAWGSNTTEADTLLANASKFRTVMFGIAFNQTDPDLIDRLIGVDGAYVVSRFSGGTFHPKIYCFRSGDSAAAIIGSANFTNGGLVRNLEAAISIAGSANDPIFQSIFAFLNESMKFGCDVTEDLAAAYRASCKRANRLPKPPRDPLVGFDKQRVRGLTSPITKRTWDEFAKSVRETKHHNVTESLELLRISQRWLAGVGSFAELKTPQRKAIAGILGENQKTDEELKHGWGWFGSMTAMGDFARLVGLNDKHLARAIDSIPRLGEVTEDHYNRFCLHFARAFNKSSRSGGVPTASRLLAMARPDTFLCVCSPNIAEASKAMGFAKTTLTLENYWNRIVEVIRSSDWYRSSRPSGPVAAIWDYRAAMLDAIFYRP